MGGIFISIIISVILFFVLIIKKFQMSSYAKVIDDYYIKVKFLSEKFKSLEKSPILISELKKNSIYSQLVDLLLDLEKTNKGLIKKLENTSWFESKNLSDTVIMHPELINVNGKKEINPETKWEVEM